MRKTIIIIITIVIIGVIITIISDTFMGTRFWKGEDAWICQNNEWVRHGNPSALKPTSACGEPEETEQKIEVHGLMQELEQATEINFSDMQSVEVKWNVKKYEQVQEVIIQGKGFKVKGISNEQQTNIRSFLEDKGFKADLYNIASGTISGLTGYKKDQIVCTVAGGVSGYKKATGQWVAPDTDKYDVEVKCAEAHTSIEHLISKDEAIRKLFAEKYKTKVSAINIDISEETKNHVRGIVQILDELVQEGPGQMGIFLAAKVNNNWELAFEGIGTIFCQEMEKYNFPADMIKDCYQP